MEHEGERPGNHEKAGEVESGGGHYEEGGP